MRIGGLHAIAHSSQSDRHERVELSTHAEISTAWKVGSIIAGASPRE